MLEIICRVVGEAIWYRFTSPSKVLQYTVFISGKFNPLARSRKDDLQRSLTDRFQSGT